MQDMRQKPEGEMSAEHNPDNLSQEQYGAPEWRLLSPNETIKEDDEFWSRVDKSWHITSNSGGCWTPERTSNKLVYRRRVATRTPLPSEGQATAGQRLQTPSTYRALTREGRMLLQAMQPPATADEKDAESWPLQNSEPMSPAGQWIIDQQAELATLRASLSSATALIGECKAALESALLEVVHPPRRVLINAALARANAIEGDSHE